jgi:hypothetical protein
MSNSSQQDNFYASSISADSISTITLTSPISNGPWTDTCSIAGSNFYTTSSISNDFIVKNAGGVEVLSVPNSSNPALKVSGDIMLNGDSLTERLERIETMLQIPTRDAIIEEQYPKLKRLYEEYIKELEKCKTWNRLKKGTER